MTAETKDDRPRRPWRDNLEAVTMAIVMAVMLKYFIVEAYKIPTGSMQPTLLGNVEAGIYDRIIVDKLSYHYRDPERWEVVVFKYPLDRSKNFIKRVCGIPGEQFRIENGDLWSRPGKDAEWRVLRKPRSVQREVLKRIDPDSPRYASWKTLAGAQSWSVDGRAKIRARGDGSARLPNDGGSVTDAYRDGYPGRMGRLLRTSNPGSHPVGDVRIEGEVRALAGCKLVAIELREGNARYAFELPGPAAAADATPRIVVQHLAANSGAPDARVAAAKPTRLPTNAAVAFAAQNLDDLLSLEIDGEVVAEIEIAPAANQASSITLRVEGEGADFDDLETYRDIYYTESISGSSEFDIPKDAYVMLGDNTQDSSDSREWQFVRYRWPGSDGYVRGNWVTQNNNPTEVRGAPEGTRIFFRDEWGELHTFLAQHAERGSQLEFAPYVPRHLITGRAVVVFWPLTPLWPPNWFDKSTPAVWRLKWIH